MQPEAFPVVVAIVAVFAAFMAVLGGAVLWTALPHRSETAAFRASLRKARRSMKTAGGPA